MNTNLRSTIAANSSSISIQHRTCHYLFTYISQSVSILSSQADPHRPFNKVRALNYQKKTHSFSLVRVNSTQPVSASVFLPHVYLSLHLFASCIKQIWNAVTLAMPSTSAPKKKSRSYDVVEAQHERMRALCFAVYFDIRCLRFFLAVVSIIAHHKHTADLFARVLALFSFRARARARTQNSFCCCFSLVKSCVNSDSHQFCISFDRTQNE